MVITISAWKTVIQMVRPFDELMNAYIGDVLVKEALGTLLVIANDVLVTLGLKLLLEWRIGHSRKQPT